MALFIGFLVLTLTNKTVWLKKSIDILLRMVLPYLLEPQCLSNIGMNHSEQPCSCITGRPLQFHMVSLPYNLLFNHVPDYKALRIFGCACYPNTRPYDSHKLGFWSVQCTFLRYSLTHKGYKCLDPSGKIFISRDVIFYEHLFPFSESLSS